MLCCWVFSISLLLFCTICCVGILCACVPPLMLRDVRMITGDVKVMLIVSDV